MVPSAYFRGKSNALRPAVSVPAPSHGQGTLSPTEPFPWTLPLGPSPPRFPPRKVERTSRTRQSPLTLAAFLPWGSSQDSRHVRSVDHGNPGFDWCQSTGWDLCTAGAFPIPFHGTTSHFVARGCPVYICRRRIRLAAYVTRLERVRELNPTGVQIPYPPPREPPVSSDPGVQSCPGVGLSHVRYVGIAHPEVAAAPSRPTSHCVMRTTHPRLRGRRGQVYIVRRRIRLAAYVTRLERVRELNPTGVQIPYPPPHEPPASSDPGVLPLGVPTPTG